MKGCFLLSYAIIETSRRIVQLIFGSELFDLPILSSLRKVMYRLCFDIGKSPTIGFGMRFFRSHRMKNGTVKVGNNVLLAKHSEIDYSGKVVIGDNVWISEGVQIHTHNHLLTATRITDEKANIVPTEIYIGNNAWIGARAVILPSVSQIGENAVIGAGAIVTKNVPPNTVVAGNPAKVIRTLEFNDEIK